MDIRFKGSFVEFLFGKSDESRVSDGGEKQRGNRDDFRGSSGESIEPESFFVTPMTTERCRNGGDPKKFEIGIKS